MKIRKMIAPLLVALMMMSTTAWAGEINLQAQDDSSTVSAVPTETLDTENVQETINSDVSEKQSFNAAADIDVVENDDDSTIDSGEQIVPDEKTGEADTSMLTAESEEESDASSDSETEEVTYPVTGDGFVLTEDGLLTITADIDETYDYAWNNYSYNEIKVEEGVTEIPGSAFSFSEANKVTLPSTLESIGDSAFSNCEALTSVALPDGLRTIGSSAFAGCSVLETLTVPESVTSIDNMAFARCSSLKKLVFPSVLQGIEQGLCSNCTALEEVTMPKKVTENTTFGIGAFNMCASLKSITVPDGIVTIANSAFSYCTSLEEINLPDTFSDADSTSFEGTPWLENYMANHDGIMILGHTLVAVDPSKEGEVIVPDGITKICNYAFFDCDKVTKVELPDTVTDFGICVFYGCSALESVNIPTGIDTIGYGTFEGCSSLKSMDIPDTITTVGAYAFAECDSLTDVKMSESVTEINEYTFYHCTSLKNINIPSGTTYIGDRAFWTCSSLEYVTLPDSLTQIDTYAFCRCTSLKEMIIPDSVKSVGDCCFSRCYAMTKLVLPKDLDYIGEYFCYMDSSLTSLDIPDGVTYIGESAFQECTNLAEIHMPASLTEIASYAFKSDTALKSIEIPEGVTTIGEYAFNRSGLEEISLPSTLTSVGYAAFSRCYSLKSINVPDGVTAIPDYFCYHCDSLTSVSLPDSLVSIGDSAFDADPAIEDALFRGTKDEWDQVTVDKDNTYLTDKLHFYTSIENAEVTLGKVLIENGSEQTQEISGVTVDGEEAAYQVTGNVGTKAGVYTMTITGTGSYTGSITKTFVIAPSKGTELEKNQAGAYVLGEGTLDVVVKAEGVEASLNTDKAEVIAMLAENGSLTAEDLAVIAEGQNAQIILTVKDNSDTIEAKVKNEIDKNIGKFTAGQYLDISLQITIGEKTTVVSSTPEVLSITIRIPEKLLNKDTAITRQFCMVRDHEGNVKLIGVVYGDDDSLTFDTDLFSEYAIAYKDVKNSQKDSDKKTDDNGNSGQQNDKKSGNTSKTNTSATVKTGDTSNTGMYLAIMLASLAMIIAGIFRRFAF